MATRQKRDLILIIGALLAALLIWLWILLNGSPGAHAIVSVDGQNVSRHALTQDADIYIGDGDHHNRLIIQAGAARISEASCPDGLCIAQGSVSFSGQSIVCLPNKTTITIVGGESIHIDEVSR